MRIRIDAVNEAATERVRRLLRFSLASVADEIDEIAVDVVYFRDTLGMPLIRCCIKVHPFGGTSSVHVEDVQSSEHIAVSRALDKALRTLRRRLHYAA